MNPTLKDIKDTEFNRIHYNTLDDDYFEVIEGRIPVLLSAPHGAKHLRNGKWKEEDEYTSSIAIKLGGLTGAHVIFARNKTKEDSNFLKKTRYKDAIKKLVQEKGIRFVADIHGAKKDRPYKVNVGIIDKSEMKRCSCPTFKAVIEGSFKDFQNPLFNLDSFTAGTPETVTCFARHECGIEAAQFEINAKYRIINRKPDSSKAMNGKEPDFKAKEQDVLEMLKHMEKMILRINGKLEEKK